MNPYASGVLSLPDQNSPSGSVSRYKQRSTPVWTPFKLAYLYCLSSTFSSVTKCVQYIFLCAQNKTLPGFPVPRLCRLNTQINYNNPNIRRLVCFLLFCRYQRARPVRIPSGQMPLAHWQQAPRSVFNKGPWNGWTHGEPPPTRRKNQGGKTMFGMTINTCCSLSAITLVFILCFMT
jgi:hypothetical protein